MLQSPGKEEGDEEGGGAKKSLVVSALSMNKGRLRRSAAAGGPCMDD